MNPLFSKNSLTILESLSFTKTLYSFDFDGTLSKIVSTPSEATITRTTDELLKKLSTLAPVAIISGRSISDLKDKLKFKPPYIVGNHGLEGLEKNPGSLSSALNTCLAWKETLSKTTFDPGIDIEDKTYSLSIHYRRSRNKKTARETIKNTLSQLMPLPRVVAGKSVYNVLPIGAPHKGVALLELMKQTGANHAFYIGDDDTDEDVFGLPEAKIMTVRVGCKIASHARFYIDRQTEINRVLTLLIRFHEKTGAEK